MFSIIPYSHPVSAFQNYESSFEEKPLITAVKDRLSRRVVDEVFDSKYKKRFRNFVMNPDTGWRAAKGGLSSKLSGFFIFCLSLFAASLPVCELILSSPRR